MNGRAHPLQSEVERRVLNALVAAAPFELGESLCASVIYNPEFPRTRASDLRPAIEALAARGAIRLRYEQRRGGGEFFFSRTPPAEQLRARISEIEAEIAALADELEPLRAALSAAQNGSQDPFCPDPAQPDCAPRKDQRHD